MQNMPANDSQTGQRKIQKPFSIGSQGEMINCLAVLGFALPARLACPTQLACSAQLCFACSTCLPHSPHLVIQHELHEGLGADGQGCLVDLEIVAVELLGAALLLVAGPKAKIAGRAQA